MATFPQALLNLNTWRVLTAGFLLALGNGGSPFWWIAAVPWFVLNLPGLLLTTIPAWLVLAAGPAAVQSTGGTDGFIITLCVLLPSALSLLMSWFWTPLLQKSRLFGEFHYPGA